MTNTPLAAPAFDTELNLHRAQPQPGSLRMRMEARVDGRNGKYWMFRLTQTSRLMEACLRDVFACLNSLRA